MVFRARERHFPGRVPAFSLLSAHRWRRADEATRRSVSSKILAGDAGNNSRRRTARSVALCTGTETCSRTLIATALADQTITAFEEPFCPAMGSTLHLCGRSRLNVSGRTHDAWDRLNETK